MDSKTLSNFHRFGKVGRIVITILMVVTIMVTAVCAVAAVYVSTLPREALSVRVTEYAEFRINEEKFQDLWRMLANRVSYAGDTVPEGILSGASGAAVPPEGQNFETDLSFFDHAYSSAQIYSDGGTKVIEAKSAPAEYRSTSLIPVLISLTLRCACEAVALLLLRRLFAVLAVSETPFCDLLVKRLKTFGLSLLPVALLATVSETLSAAFLSAGADRGLRIQWGILLAFAVTMFVTIVFRYGVQLQKESDETL